MDSRIPFDDAISVFLDFLNSQGWSRDVLWLSRDRITGHRTDNWIYKPDELHSVISTRGWYEDARKEDWNLRIEGIGQYSGSTLAFVARGPGKSRSLNFAVLTSTCRLHIMNSRLRWFVCRNACRVRGESPMLLNADIPMRAELISVANVG